LDPLLLAALGRGQLLATLRAPYARGDGSATSVILLGEGVCSPCAWGAVSWEVVRRRRGRC
ncbi:hypothetical protein ACFVIN_35840, partial [Streptomyces prasinus]|uniref:hypothetical protein n=1 Tax=Streptomyces prasinus TaxID=67345 RepID=UPI00363B73C6